MKNKFFSKFVSLILLISIFFIAFYNVCYSDTIKILFEFLLIRGGSKEILFLVVILVVVSISLIVYLLAISWITRIKVEANLRKSEELLKTLINATPDIICFKDGSGCWLEANIAMLTLFGLNNVAFKGKDDIILARYAPQCNDIFTNCTQNDEEVWLKGKISREERILRQPDGNLRTYDLIKVPTFKAY